MTPLQVNALPPDSVVQDIVCRATGRLVRHVARTPNPDAGVGASELVRCTFADGGHEEFFCKYGPDAGGRDASACGSVAYEARVYEAVLTELGMGRGAFVGSGRDGRSTATTIVLVHLADHERVDRAADMPGAMRRAARWMGAFHAAAEREVSEGTPLPLAEFDDAYYRQWARRTREYTAGLDGSYPWLSHVLDLYERVVETLAARPRTVIHGDFYADNVLVRGDEVAVIDWSWAAIGAGEIDLASLTERWPEEYVAACVDAYRRARWPDAGDADTVYRAVDAARVYLCCRWLGHSEEWVRDERRRWRFDALRQAAGRIGIL
jgi:hypothetical protein